MDRIQLDQAMPPGLLRLLASALYDLMLVFGVLVIAAAVLVIPYGILTATDLAATALGRRLLQFYSLTIIVSYYLYFWSGGRQSLGMRAWRLKLVRDDGGDLDILCAGERLFWALLTLLPLGLGLWWMLKDPQRRTAYDHLAATRVVLVAK